MHLEKIHPKEGIAVSHGEFEGENGKVSTVQQIIW
jgi:hypothetical protein